MKVDIIKESEKGETPFHIGSALGLSSPTEKIMKGKGYVKPSIPVQSVVITKRGSGTVEKMENLLVVWRIRTNVHCSEPYSYSNESCIFQSSLIWG
jgi:hypothetical protein